MKDHEWHEPDAETGERRYFRAGKFGKRWTVRSTLKSDPDWTDLQPVPRPVLETLRTLLFNKYQRRRVPWEDVVAVDRLVAAAGGTAIHAPEKESPRKS